MRLDYSWTWHIREQLIKGIIQVCIFFVMWASKSSFLSLRHHCSSFLKPNTLDASVTSCSVLGDGSWKGSGVQKSIVFSSYWSDLAFISTYRSCLPEYKCCPKLFGCVVQPLKAWAKDLDIKRPTLQDNCNIIPYSFILLWTDHQINFV